MSEIRLGSLFDGIGVFPLAAVRCGIVPAWASEIEKAPISITKRHFPGMAHLGDVTKLDGGDIPPVHIITFGSPCQNLSQIGNRAGLAGEKSSLFFHAIRIIREMREATNGIFPAIAVWENVMGAFFSNDRMDFRAVLSAFTAADISMPASGRWAGAGMVRGHTPDLAWRLMDAQHWASPRLARRQRVFVVADFGGQCSHEILFKPRAVSPFAFWYEDDPAGGCVRFPTERECERLMGLPEGWTKYGADGEEILPAHRYRALGNAIALPCAEYIMCGIYDVLTRRC